MEGNALAISVKSKGMRTDSSHGIRAALHEEQVSCSGAIAGFCFLFLVMGVPKHSEDKVK